MKILYGITKSNFGGAQRYVFDLAMGAQKAGHDVTVFCGGTDLLYQKLVAEGINTCSIDALGRDVSLGDLESFLEIRRIVKDIAPDVLHLNSSKVGAMGAVIGRILGVDTVVFTAHGWAFNESRPYIEKILLKFAYWVCMMFSHIVICVSGGTKQHVAHWPFIKQKLIVIRNGIENFTLLPQRAARKILAQDTALDTYVVGTISELHHIKGLDVLLRSWSEFRAHHDGTLIIIGNGEEKEELQNMANLLGISDSVIWAGFIEDARTYLSALDLFILASRSEAFPYSPLEAGHAGLPVIATTVGGVPEIIHDGETGLLVPPEDPVGLLAAIVRLTNDRPFAESLGENLKKFVDTEYSRDRMVRATLIMYEYEADI